MKTLLLWQIISLAVGLWASYTGIKTLRLNDKQFIERLRQAAKRNAKIDGITEKEALERYADNESKDPKTWRRFMGGRMLAVGLVSLCAFILLVLLDIGT
jgi:hypothetical protein